ncbi:hypothetical protein D3C71_2165530 [compost metagenome]
MSGKDYRIMRVPGQLIKVATNLRGFHHAIAGKNDTRNLPGHSLLPLLIIFRYNDTLNTRADYTPDSLLSFRPQP